MIIGITATSLTFVALIISIASYYLYHKRGEDALLKIARLGFYTATALIVLQSSMLMWGIINHKFEWMYVFSYSSRDLTLYYLISTFWAGQEGTFLLWLLLGSVYGLIIIRSRKEDEPLVMSFMNLVQAFIVMILIKKNPFTYVWEINPSGFQAGIAPFDGNGLNPLLQDPWMTIHPPILFSGYSSTMIIFAFAMAALIRRNYNDWIKSAFPFALFVGLSLGTGIILGGYWAYTTLGWGGYWGWDPVENSSLIPWLTSLALIHGFMIQKKQGGMKKTNIFLALLTFVLVLYGSFLTRSGVLTDFSVHSFGASELSTYLVGFVVFFTGLAALTFMFRVQEVKSEKVQTAFFTRESFMLFGILTLLVLATFTFFGTSSPLITGMFGTASNVSIEYYNTLAGPIAILIALLISLAPLLSWKRDSAQKIKSVIIQGAVSLLLGAVMFALGIRDIVPLIIAILAVFVILINGEIVNRMIKAKTYAFGGYLAHVGIGLMLIGIITSSVYDSSVKVTLPMDTNRNVMGYDLKYGGKLASPDGKDKVLITINDSKETFAKFYWSEYSQAYMVAPSVQNMIFKDLYISPIQIIPADQTIPQTDDLELKKNEPLVYGDYTFVFTGYDMNSHEMESSDMKIAAVIETGNGKEGLKEIIKPAIGMRGDEKEIYPATLPGTDRSVFIKSINVESKSLLLGVAKQKGSTNAANGKEILAVEVTIKPLINLLWLGTVIMISGFITSIYFRTNRKKL